MRRTLIAALVVSLSALLVPVPAPDWPRPQHRPSELRSAAGLRHRADTPDLQAKIRKQGAASVSRTARAMTLALAQKGDPHVARLGRRRRVLLHEELSAPWHRRAHRGVDGGREPEVQRGSVHRLAVPERRLPHRRTHQLYHERPDPILHRPVRQQHLPDRVGPSSACRPTVTVWGAGDRRARSPGRLLHGRRRRHRRPDRQRP